MPLKAVLFDLDGTLLDTKNLILSSFRHAFAQVVGEVPSDAELLDLVGIPLASQMQRLCPERAGELLVTFREFNHRRHDELAGSFEGVSAALAALRESGLRMAVVTSKLHALAWHGLELFGLEGYFEFLVGADDCEGHKPSPRPLLFAAEQMGLAAGECAYVGDSPYDMEAARSANMLAIGVLWGMFSEERLLAAGAERIAASPQDLAGLLRI